MTFLRRLLGKSKPQDNSFRGSAPIVSEADQDAARTRMEAEVQASKDSRAEKAAEDEVKDSTT